MADPREHLMFFSPKWEEVIEGMVAADERRHNVAHLSQWLSLKDMIQQTKDKCPEDTAIPSKSLVRLQFTPRNPYSRSALNFTSRLPVQYKIQRRQLRVSHEDAHYCDPQFKYLKQYATMMQTSNNKIVMFVCDDKAKVPIGEPGVPISTGVRGKKSIMPTTSTLGAMDHDFHPQGLPNSICLSQMSDSRNT